MRLRTGTKVTGVSGTTYIVESFVDLGGQADVYRATSDENGSGTQVVALKIFRDDWLHVDPGVMGRIRTLKDEDYPKLGLTEFVWPQDAIVSDTLQGFVMPFVPSPHMPLEDVLEASETAGPEYAIERLPLRTVTKIAAMLADTFNRLHSEGIAYRDLNPRNVMVDPKEGTIAILDTEHCVTNRAPVNIAGPPPYRAPELWHSAYPNDATDRYSLAVIFFKLLMIGHPLEGALDPDSLPSQEQQRKLYADEALFVFHPADARNRPVPGRHDFAIKLWPALPEYMRALFTATFTDGLKNPGQRVRENAWLPAFLRLHGSIVACAECRAENFADPQEPARPCYVCGKDLPRYWQLVTRSEHPIVLEPGSTLSRWQLDWQNDRNDATRVAQVIEREAGAEAGRVLGLKNVGAVPWRVRRFGAPPSDEAGSVAPGKVLQLGNFSHIAFGPRDSFIALLPPRERS